jgi:hypothetical protein
MGKIPTIVPTMSYVSMNIFKKLGQPFVCSVFEQQFLIMTKEMISMAA